MTTVNQPSYSPKAISEAQVARITQLKEKGLISATTEMPTDSYHASGIIGNAPASRFAKDQLRNLGGSVKPAMTDRECQQALKAVECIKLLQEAGSKSAKVGQVIADLSKLFCKAQ